MRTLILTLLAIAGLALVEDAQADLALWFASARAHWEQRVRVSSPGRYAAFSGVRVYLVPTALARSARIQKPTGPPHDRRITPLGPVHLDHSAVLRIAFRIPRVRPGDYTIGFWCKPCAPPRGSFFTTARPGQRWTPAQHKIVRISRR
jgi:hypothetical protein